MSLGTRLTEQRKKAGLTQGQLGDTLNISPQAISKWENDQAEPDLNTLKRLAEIYHVTLDELTEATSSAKEPKEEKRTEAPLSVIGFCTSCGITVTQENLGAKEPKCFCTKCYSVYLAEEEERQKALLAEQKA
ncbi:MAG: helix-turn-helix domain-containing protein, partial [Clostridia bacterium]|nr:helix-turn-helix domain-containing protein [Clostridia bacterium]